MRASSAVPRPEEAAPGVRQVVALVPDEGEAREAAVALDQPVLLDGLDVLDVLERVAPLQAQPVVPAPAAPIAQQHACLLRRDAPDAARHARDLDVVVVVVEDEELGAHPPPGERGGVEVDAHRLAVGRAEGVGAGLHAEARTG